MYQPEAKSKAYITVIALFAALVGWAFYKYYQPIILESSCSEIAANASNLNSAQSESDPYYSFDNLKSRCLQDISFAQK